MRPSAGAPSGSNCIPARGRITAHNPQPVVTRKRIHGILGEGERPNMVETRLANSLKG